MDTRYSNPGKLLRELLPDQGLTQGTILVWTVVYLLNLAAVLLVQYHLIYTLPRPDGTIDDRPLFQVLAEKERFEGYEFLDLAYALDGHHILCRNEVGETVIVTMKRHGFFDRCCVTAGEKAVTDGKHIDTDGLLGTSYVVVTGSSITDTGGYSLNFDSAELMAPLLWALLPFSLEALIHSILRRALSG